jgi:hypothetical protein
VDLIDIDNDGVPDAFEQRPSITEILNSEEEGTIVLELEATPRKPKQGEVYVSIGELKRAMVDYTNINLPGFRPFIVKRVVLGQPTIVNN